MTALGAGSCVIRLRGTIKCLLKLLEAPISCSHFGCLVEYDLYLVKEGEGVGCFASCFLPTPDPSPGSAEALQCGGIQ